MEYMEMRMQEQIEAGIERMNDIQREFELFRQWFISLDGDIDETLVSWEHMKNGVNFESPSETTNAMWLAWRGRAGV